MTKSELRELFTYSEGKVQRKNRRLKGGSYDKDGYLRTKIKGKTYGVHRLIYIYHYGDIKDKYIDHINRVRDDNRIENLRVVTPQQNNFNMGAKGYTYIPRLKLYRSQIKIKGKQIMLGCHKTEEKARKAYLKAKEVYHPV